MVEACGVQAEDVSDLQYLLSEHATDDKADTVATCEGMEVIDDTAAHGFRMP